MYADGRTGCQNTLLLNRPLDRQFCYTNSVETETEYKFALLDDTFPTLDTLRVTFVAAELSLGPHGTRKQYDRYFDSRRGKLRRAGYALRERTVDGKKMATLKAAKRVSGARHEYDELELPLEDGQWPHQIRMQVAEVVALTRLEPLLDLRTYRTRFRVGKRGRTVAEIAFDEVRAMRPGRDPSREMSVHFYEVEVEAQPETDADELERVAGLLESTMTLTPSASNKVERAEALLSLAGSLEE